MYRGTGQDMNCYYDFYTTLNKNLRELAIIIKSPLPSSERRPPNKVICVGRPDLRDTNSRGFLLRNLSGRYEVYWNVKLQISLD